MNVWQYASLGDSDSAEEFVELLVVADGKLNMTWDDAGLLVVTGGVASKLEDLGSKVFEDGGKVDWSAGANASSILALL